MTRIEIIYLKDLEFIAMLLYFDRKFMQKLELFLLMEIRRQT